MSADIEELHEHAEHGSGDERMAPVTVSMAILAVFAAVVTLMGERVHAEAMLAQTRATDQWSQYQAEKIRQRSYELFMDELTVFSLQNPARVDDLKGKYGKEIQHYVGETGDIQKQAYATEAAVATLERRSDRFDFGDVFLEAGLVICSITLLTQKRAYWYLGLLSGLTGIVIAAAGLFVH